MKNPNKTNTLGKNVHLFSNKEAHFGHTSAKEFIICLVVFGILQVIIVLTIAALLP